MTSWIVAVALSVVSFSSYAFAESKDAIVGTWKLISAKETTEEGEVRDASEGRSSSQTGPRLGADETLGVKSSGRERHSRVTRI